MPVIEVLATIENQRSSHRGTCFDAEYPVALDTKPTTAVTAKWNPVSVVAVYQKTEIRQPSEKF